MVAIPAGTNKGIDPDSGAYSLTVDAFFMDATEVTKAKWDEVRIWAATNGYTDLTTGGGKATNHPVHSVSWYDCVKWCNARSQKAERTPVYYQDADMTQVYKAGNVSELYVKTSANGYRLPTDVQWEYAARGGVPSRRFPWSDTDTIQYAQANFYTHSTVNFSSSLVGGGHPTYAEDPRPYTSPAGSFAPNGYELYDMAGNVSEWCFDWFPAYKGAVRVVRGGSWGSFAACCGVGARSNCYPDCQSNAQGFRTVLPPSQQ